MTSSVLFSKYNALWFVFDGIAGKVVSPLMEFYLTGFSELFFDEIPKAFVILPTTLIGVAIMYGFRSRDTSAGSRTLGERTWAVVAILSAVLIIVPLLIDIFMPSPPCDRGLDCLGADLGGFLSDILFFSVPGVIVGFIAGTMLIILGRSRA